MAGAMPRIGVVDVAPPRRGPLLGLADQHQSGSTGRGRLVLVGPSDVLFGLSGLEADNGHPGALLERLELGNESFAVAVEQCGRGDGAASIEQELHHPTLVLESWDVAADTDAVHRSAAKADVLVQ